MILRTRMRTWLGEAGVAALVLGVYCATAYRYISGGDSGELAVASCQLGVAHPPGYPTFTVLGWAAIRLSVALGISAPSQAFRLHVLSAALGAAAAVFVMQATNELVAGAYCSGPRGAKAGEKGAGGTGRKDPKASAAADATRSSSLGSADQNDRQRPAGEPLREGEGEEVERPVWPGFVAACGFAFSPTVWLYSIQNEVFPLNNFLVALLLLLTVRYFSAAASRRADANSGSSLVRRALLGSLVCGLAMTNQHTTVLYTVPTAAAVTAHLGVRRLLSVRTTVLLVVALAVGLAPYAYLPLASARQPMDAWGDQRSLSGFVHHFLRREYGTFQLASDQDTDPGMLVRLGVYWRNLVEESHAAVPLLAVVGTVWLLRGGARGRRWSGSVILANYLVYLLVFHYLANLDPNRPLFLGVQARFWQQLNLYVFVAAAVGGSVILRAACRWAAAKVPGVLGSGDGAESAAGRVHRWLPAAVAVALAGGHILRWYPARDFSQTRCFQEESERSMASFPRNSIVLLNGDLNNNLLKYPAGCEGLRPDLRLLSLQLMSWEWFVPMQSANYPGVRFPGWRYHPREPDGFSLRAFLDANGAGRARRAFLCGPFKEGDDSHAGAYELIPFGLCDELVPVGVRPGAASWAVYLAHSWHSLPRSAELGPWLPDRYTPDSWEAVLYSDLWHRRAYLASYIAFESNKRPDDEALLALAAHVYAEQFDRHEEALVRSVGLARPSDYRDAGIVFGQYSKLLAGRGRPGESDWWSKQMMRLWARFVRMPTETSNIDPFVRDLVNPYTGQRLEAAPYETEPLALFDPLPRPPALSDPLRLQPGVNASALWGADAPDLPWDDADSASRTRRRRRRRQQHGDL